MDDEVNVHIRLIRYSVLLVFLMRLKNATDEGLLDHGHLLFRGCEPSEGDIVAVAHDACGGVDGDASLLDWRLLEDHGRGHGCCGRSLRRCHWSIGCIVWGGRLEGVDEGPTLGGCESLRVDVAVGVRWWDGHDGEDKDES